MEWSSFFSALLTGRETLKVTCSNDMCSLKRQAEKKIAKSVCNTKALFFTDPQARKMGRMMIGMMVMSV